MQLDPAKVKEMNAQLKFDKYVIRHLIVNVEEFGDNHLISNKE
jgi:ribosomal protein S6